MPISLENKPDSGIALLKAVGSGDDSKLIPFAFPGQKISIPADTAEYLTRVPVPKPIEENALVSVKDARESIPVGEAMGKGLDGYIVESLPTGEGGSVNGVKIEVGVPISDAGIIFVAD